jgi:adhesin/invasin
LQPIATTGGTDAEAGKTDASGRSTARLTTQGSADNRRIKVTATTPTTTGEVKQDSIIIAVVGTTIAITGPSSVIINTTATFTVTLVNSAGRGVEGERVTISSALGNSFDNQTPVTNALGQAKVTLTASKAGKDTITVSKTGAGESKLEITISDDNFEVTASPPGQGLCPNLSDNEDLNNNRLLDPGEDLNDNSQLDLGCQVALGQEQGFKVHWDKGGNPQPNKNIILATTRGQLGSNSVLTDFEGNAIFTLRSDNDSGDAIVTVRAEEVGGPSRQFNVKFIATNPTSINVQANPAVINTNPVGTDIEQSEILAVVRDAKNNLVYGRRVNFVLTDVTGGRLTLGSAITDDFGQAKTTYIAGPSSSAAGGVVIKATVAETSPEVSAEVKLTVAQKSLFVTIGSGNELEKEGEGRRYKVHNTLLVTDSNGTPVGDAEVILSIYPLVYVKATIDSTDPENPLVKVTGVCPNEDVNRNGILDPGEDLNNNGSLEPGNVVTVDNLKFKTSTGGEGNDPKGFADFDVIYAIQYAEWVTAEITARAAVAGSEGTHIMRFDTVCSADDKKANICPQQSPFGVGKCTDPF